MTNPVHEENGKWYFWDETGAGRMGPYATEAEAELSLDAYCRTALAPRETVFKHCATCKLWTPEEEDPDTGSCSMPAFNSIDPPIGGIAISGEFFTHAVFGCVNHKPKGR